MNEQNKPNPSTLSADKTTLKFSSVKRKAHANICYDESPGVGGYVNWGRDNKFPYHLWDLYMHCSTLQAIINGSADYTLGNGIVNNTPFVRENTVGETLEDILGKCALDLWVFGGFALQVFYNAFGTPISVAYINICKCRISETLDRVYIVDEFKTFGRGLRGTISVPAFGTLTQEERATQGSEILFYKGKKTKGYYPVCDYISSLISAETQIEIKRFHYNNISNGMLSASIINFNNAEDVTDEVKDQLEAAIKQKFGGADGAGEIMISWNADKEHELSIAKLDDDNFDAKFSTLAEDTRDDLFIAFRAIPVVFGLTVNTGFNTQEFEEAFALYNRTAIKPKQNELIRCLDKIFNMGQYAGNDLHAIEIIPFSLGTPAAGTEDEEAETAGTGEEAGAGQDNAPAAQTPAPQAGATGNPAAAAASRHAAARNSAAKQVTATGTAPARQAARQTSRFATRSSKTARK